MAKTEEILGSLPKVKLEHPVFQFDGNCLDQVALDIIIEAMDSSIETAYKKLEGAGKVFADVESTGMKTLATIKAVRDAVYSAPICGAKPKKTEEMSRKSVKEGKTTEELYPGPWATVKDKSGKILRYEDAKGKPIPKELWPKP